jgi:hypothetical protein
MVTEVAKIPGLPIVTRATGDRQILSLRDEATRESGLRGVDPYNLGEAASRAWRRRGATTEMEPFGAWDLALYPILSLLFLTSIVAVTEYRKKSGL